MPAPKGNKFAVGANSGRPRTTSFEPDQMIALGEEMVKWVEENQPLHLSEWYTCKKMFTYEQWKKFIEKQEFRPYYQHSLRIVGKKYLDGTVNSSIAHRFLRIYFRELKELEDADLVAKHQIEFDFKKNLLELEIKLKANTDGAINEEIKEQYKALMNQFSQLQGDRKIDDNNSNAAAKS